MNGEVIPLKAENSRSENYSMSDQMYGPGNAIDLKLETLSHTVPNSDGKTWHKIILSQIHCVRQVVRFRMDGTVHHKWNCSRSGCSDCQGEYCSTITVTIVTEGLAQFPEMSGNCGDTVKLERLDAAHSVDIRLRLFEVAVIGRATGKNHLKFKRNFLKLAKI